MHDDHRLIEDRLRRVLTERLPAAVHTPIDVALDITAWHAPGEPVPFAEAVEQRYLPFAVGQAWGRPWGTTWFHVTGTIGRGFKGRRLELLVDLGHLGGPGFTCEGLVHLPDGSTIKGLHPRSQAVPLRDGQSKIDVWIEAAANPDVTTGGFTVPTTLGAWDTAGDEPMFTLRRLEIAELETDVYHLSHDFEVIGQLITELPTDGARRWELTAAVSAALDVLDPHDITGTAVAARERLAPVLQAPAQASAHRIAAVGHAHIDSAWLWPLRETVRKVARTVSNVVQLAEEHPDLVFAFSSAQQHAWLKEHHPKVWRKLKKAVADQVIVPVGGMWVESDTNMVGAEAMCRQFSHGKRFFLEEYGIETDEVWLPDSFGYAAGLPQIVAQSATTYFLTQKISWNQVNKFPHHTFWWEGIDGTRVFTHFPSADTYNSDITGAELAHAARNCQDKAGGNRSLLPFGFGDGGGGPTREQIERIRRTRDLEGSSTVQISRPDDFFAAAHSEFGERAQVWSGELYLEMHRGTYTSQARTKQGNRRNEHLLREAEIWCTTAAVRLRSRYPYEALDRLWKQVLLLQFHDILPGSSIAWVHREAEQMHDQISAELSALITEAQQSLAGSGEVAMAFNGAGHERHLVPALGARRLREPGRVKVVHQARGWTIANGLITVRINNSGVLTSVIDHAADDDELDREVLAGPSNLLQLHTDTPNQWDAWDVDSFYRNSVTDLTEVDEITGIERGIRIVRTVGASRIEQSITLEPGTDRVDFAIEVDWHHRETLLKAGFLLDVHAERSAAETQFGHVFRPTHSNTSWDAARFEICAQRYLHLAEQGYGVALVNDSTYGHDVERVATAQGRTATSARLSLLRSPRFPDPDADQGPHTLRYALVVGAEPVAAVREGMMINLPERIVGGSGDPVAPLVTIDDDEIVVSAVKLADDGSGDVVVRVYQSTGARSRARLELGFPASGVVVTDLLERPIGGRGATASPLTESMPVSLRHGAVDLDLRPFQMVTLRFAR